jgi:hypothetical protein
MDWLSIVTSLISALIGACVAGRYSHKSIDKSFVNQRRLEHEQEKQIVNALLRSIHTEIITIYAHYHKEMGWTIEDLSTDQPLTIYYPITNEYFSIYEGNVAILGRIKSDALRKQIVITYTEARAMVDSIRLNNMLYERYYNALTRYQTRAANTELTHIQELHGSLIEYARALKSAHETLKKEVGSLIEMLDEAICGAG